MRAFHKFFLFSATSTPKKQTKTVIAKFSFVFFQGPRSSLSTSSAAAAPAAAADSASLKAWSLESSEVMLAASAAGTSDSSSTSISILAATRA